MSVPLIPLLVLLLQAPSIPLPHDLPSVDLDGDGVFEVVGNRFHHEAGLGGFILAGDAKPRIQIGRASCRERV